jgi:glutathione S-transferase
MPVIKIHGMTLCQTGAILRLAAKMNKGAKGECLYPGAKDPMLSYKMDILLEELLTHADP